MQYHTLQYVFVIYILIMSFQENGIDLLKLILDNGTICPSENRKVMIYSWIVNSFGCNKLGVLKIKRQNCRIISTAFPNLVWVS